MPDRFICARGWLFLLAICLNLFLDHIIIRTTISFQRLLRLSIDFIHFIILFLLDVGWLLSSLMIKVILQSLRIRKVYQAPVHHLSWVLGAAVLQILLIELINLHVRVYSASTSSLISLFPSTTAFHHWRRIVADLFEHFHLLLAIDLPLEYVINRLLLLKSLKHVLVLLCNSSDLFLPYMSVEWSRALSIEISWGSSHKMILISSRGQPFLCRRIVIESSQVIVSHYIGHLFKQNTICLLYLSASIYIKIYYTALI